MSLVPIKRALISVSDKQGLTQLAAGLQEARIEILSSGGTSAALSAAGITVRDVADYTGFPEMMEGRLKTLHPLVHGGILCRRDSTAHMQSAEQHGIQPIDLVIVNLYPFEATVARPDVSDAEAIEKIDIGGPTLVRAAAKNHAFVAVVTDPRQYDEVLAAIRSSGGTDLTLRRKLARDAFRHTAHYDRAIAEYFLRTTAATSEPEATPDSVFPPTLQLQLSRQEILRYGENPHQQAAVYADSDARGSLLEARKLSGKELSYNNLLDLDSALGIVRDVPGPAVSVIKHNNPCGAATAAELSVATRRALDGDPLSAFGSVVGLNRPVDAATADELTKPDQFIEAIIAPGFDAEALEILTTRPKWKANVRLMDLGAITPARIDWELRRVDGGYLRQQRDAGREDESAWQTVTQLAPSEEQLRDLRFAWSLVRHVKSNAIVICNGGMLTGAGAGQMSRVDSVEIAIEKSGERASGGVLASDAFFPFPDSIERAAEAGIKAVIQPGGSRKDPDVIEACNRLGIAMLFTGRRHFKH